MKTSVCVTTYRRPEGLDRTLQSLAAQTRRPDEVIISDDNSPGDHVLAVVRRWEGRFETLRFNRNLENLGMPGNLNRAVSLATGDYVANLHDADTFTPDLLEAWTEALDRHPTAGFVFNGIGGWPWPTREGGGVILHDVDPFTRGPVFFERHYLHALSSIVWGTVMARRSAYERLLPFDARFGFVSDVDMWMRMCLHYDVAYVRRPLIVLDHSPTEQRGSGTFNWQWLDWSRQMQWVNIHRFFSKDPPRLRREIRRHRRLVRNAWLVRLLGRLRRGDLNGLTQGLSRWGAFAWSRDAVDSAVRSGGAASGDL